MTPSPLDLAASLVRAWTRVYTCRLPPGIRDARRAEIDSDLWECAHDAARPSDVRAAASVLLRLLAGVSDDLAWRTDQIALGGRSMRTVVSVGATAAVMTLLLAGIWLANAVTPVALPEPAAITRSYERRPPPPPPPPPPPRHRPVGTRTSAQAAPPAASVPPGLVCVQNALGGTRALAGVSSLRIIGETKPLASSGPRPLPGTREISVVFPDRYMRADRGRFPNGSTLGSTIGFDGRVLLSSPRLPDTEASLRTARVDFAREMLMRLPRASAGVTLSQRVVRDADQERLAIDASGADGFRATLLADADTCVPIALQYEGVDFSGPATVRVDLSEYRPFGGVRFPTVLTRSHRSTPYTEERVSAIELNAPGADQYFAPGR